jgi:polyhydroxyalkanoate synthesis regulator phasin
MNWLEILNDATPVLITAVIIPLLLAVGRVISKKLKTDMQQKYFQMANAAVITAVAETMQTFVSELKKQGKFDAEAAKKAYDMAKLKAMQIMGVAVIQAMPEIVNDFETWLKARIEAATLETKGLVWLPASAVLSVEDDDNDKQ